MTQAVESVNLTHRFGEVTALEDISFSVAEHELFGFIGPDGGGKTTLFRIFATLIIPYAGKVTLLGLDTVRDYRELRREIGYMPGRFSLYQDLTVEENLNFYATIFGTTVKENYHLIEGIYSQIEPFRKRIAGKLSGGMKQKLALSCALIHKPSVLILDEPTTGVDAVSRSEFWEMLHKLKDEGITILVSTPYMDEAIRCDRIALIQNGKILGIDTPQNVRKSFSQKLYAVSHHEKYKLLLALRSESGTLNHLPLVLSSFPFGETVHITLAADVTPETIITFLHEKGLDGATINEITPGVEDTFLELMQK
jgi:ABC-2 type transport system ATP-binding protein